MPLEVFGSSVTKWTGAGIGVGRVLLLHQGLQLLFEVFGSLGALAEHDKGFEHLAAKVIGSGDNRSLDDTWMHDENALHIEWPDPVAGHDDHIVVATAEVEFSFIVDMPDVSGQIPMPIRREALRSLVWGVRVAVEPHQRAVVGVDCNSTHPS